MTAREYLGQAYRLEQRINLKKEELENLRTLSVSVKSPGFEEHYNPNHPTDASFVKMLERIWEEEKEVSNADLTKSLDTALGLFISERPYRRSDFCYSDAFFRLLRQLLMTNYHACRMVSYPSFSGIMRPFFLALGKRGSIIEPCL